MAVVQARALYDFTSGGPGELSFRERDVLTIVRQDVGDGWWEAVSSRGETGLVPESYLELIQAARTAYPPALPTKPLPSVPPPTAKPSKSALPTAASQDEAYEDWDDDWDDDDDNSSNENAESTQSARDPNGNQKVVRRREEKGQSGPVKLTLNRFSQFTRTGVDSFLFEIHNMSDSDKTAVIINGNHGPMWKGIDDPFTCVITSPKKESKFHGIKTFIAYQIAPSFSNVQVSRRYKHFDWLQQRLTVKFSVLAVPPLPEKQISGRFEDDFVSQRLRMLQLWIDRMCKHPVVAQSEVFRHFLTCTDDKRWKVGKRAAEKDEYIGGKFFLTVKVPVQPLDARDSEAKLDNFGKLLRSMDDGVRRMSEIGESNMKKHVAFKKEFQKIGNGFASLGKSFAFDDRTVAQGLTRAIEHTGQTYNDIGQMFEQQPPNDMHHLLEGLHEYRGLLSTFPEALLMQKAAMTKIQEGSSKLSESEQQTAHGRLDVITSTVLAEIDHFNHGRIADFKGYMQQYIVGQIEFYKQITAKLEDTLRQYDSA